MTEVAGLSGLKLTGRRTRQGRLHLTPTAGAESGGRQSAVDRGPPRTYRMRGAGSGPTRTGTVAETPGGGGAAGGGAGGQSSHTGILMLLLLMLSLVDLCGSNSWGKLKHVLGEVLITFYILWFDHRKCGRGGGRK